MVEVEVRNFQSIEKASFQIDGFTVVVGRSNIGKSALVRAVKAALTGASANSFVRHGPSCLRKLKQAKTCKCHTSVHLRSEGFDLLWEKGDAINRYTYNGVVYDKAERGTPEFLQPDFATVKVGDRQELLQVADQFSPIFLLDQTGGAVADTLSDVARLDRINAAMRLVEKDRKEAVSTRKVREKDVQALRGKLDTYTGLDTHLTEVEGVTQRLDLIMGTERSLQRVDGFLLKATSALQVLKDLSRVEEVVVPDVEPIHGVAGRLTALGVFLEKYQGRCGEVDTLSGVETLALPDSSSYLDAHRRVERLGGWVEQAVDLKGWLSPWKAVDELPVPNATDLREAYQRFSLLEAHLRRYDALNDEVTTLGTSYDDVLRDEQELAKAQRELGVCPTCIRPFSECGDVG